MLVLSLRSTAPARDKVTLGTLFWLCGGSGAAVFDTDDMRSLRRTQKTTQPSLRVSARRSASSQNPGCLLVS